MTRARVLIGEDNYSIIVKGHAGFNPGNDIVCAAVSTLMYTLLQCMIAENDAGNLEEFHSYLDERGGYMRLRVKPKAETAGYVDTMFSTISTGFALVSKKYHKNVRFKYQRNDANEGEK